MCFSGYFSTPQYVPRCTLNIPPGHLHFCLVGFIIQLNSEGEIVESLHDPSGKSLSGITNVVERDGKLYIGTLEGDAVGVYDRESGGF